MPDDSPRGSRVFTVSFPPELASLVDHIARRESRTTSELLREAFRHYANLPVGEQFPVALGGLSSGDVPVSRSPMRREETLLSAKPRRATS